MRSPALLLAAPPSSPLLDLSLQLVHGLLQLLHPLLRLGLLLLQLTDLQLQQIRTTNTCDHNRLFGCIENQLPLLECRNDWEKQD